MPKLTIRIIYGCFLLSLLTYSLVKVVRNAETSENKLGSILAFLLYAPFILYTTFN